MPAFERPSAMSARTSRSRGVSESSGPRAAAGQQLRDDLGVEDRAAVRDPVDGVDEVGDVGHALLEQVADGLRVGRRAARWRSAPRRTATARGRACPAVAGAGRWRPAGPRRCASAACARRRSRCPARSRSRSARSSSAVPRVATTSSPYSARMRPSPSRRRTESSTITTRTGAPPAASSGRRPGWPGAGCPRRPGPGRPGRPGRRERCTTAPPTPSSVTSTARIGPRRVTRTRTDRRLAVLGHVGEGLADHEVGGGLDGGGRPLGQVDLQVHGDRAAGRERRERGVEPAVGEDGGVDAPHQLPQLRDGPLGLVVGVADEGDGRGVVVPRSRRSLARPRSMASATRRCCAPSWRSRSMRRRSASAASTDASRLSASCSTRCWSTAVPLGPRRARMMAPCSVAMPRTTNGVTIRTTTPASPVTVMVTARSKPVRSRPWPPVGSAHPYSG